MALAREENIRIYEVGISYRGRTYTEGKKIGMNDGFRALYCIVRYNTSRLADTVKSSLEGIFAAAVMLVAFFLLAQLDLFSGAKGLSIANALAIELSLLASCLIYSSAPSWRPEAGPQTGMLRFHLGYLLPFATRVAAFPLLMKFLDFGWGSAGVASAALGLLFSLYGATYRKAWKKK